DGIRDRNVTGVQTCALPIWIELSTGVGWIGLDPWSSRSSNRHNHDKRRTGPKKRSKTAFRVVVVLPLQPLVNLCVNVKASYSLRSEEHTSEFQSRFELV